MKERILYSELVRYYDLIYSQKDYGAEAARIKELIARYKKSPGNELLDVACGTGHHLKHLKDDFSCTGVDISDEMLMIARGNVGEVDFQQSDMTSLELGRQFDAITCLFSSIGYARTLSNLRKTMEGFARHLKSGGVVLIEPWLTREVYRVGSPYMETYDGEEVKIARLSVSRSDGDVSVIDFHYLIAEKDKGVKHFVDRHELGLFGVDETLEIMEDVGLQAQYLTEGLASRRGLYVGIKNKEIITNSYPQLTRNPVN